jgi:hypothetical protein
MRLTNKCILTGSLACWLLNVTYLLAGPGDGHWDRQFNMPGTGTRNFSLRFNSNVLYTAGYSLFSGQLTSNTIVNVFDGTNWSALGEFVGGSGTTIIYDYGFLRKDLYVAGLFNSAGGVPAGGLAKWDGTNWSGVGGFSGVAVRVESDGTNLYVGGAFTNCGGIFATNIAKWNGTNWSALGPGLGYYNNSLSQLVGALLYRNGQLYAGGAFTNAGNIAATNLAKWDGSAWSAVGGGIPGVYNIFSGNPVTSLEMIGTDLYVAGNFTSVGSGVSALNIAKWNGSAWSALGAGLKGPPNSGPVSSLAAIGSDLYATGNFTNAGGLTARVAKWDGANWSSLGAINGLGSRAVSNAGSLYICGDFNVANFNTPSNVIGNHLLRWDGSTWHGLGPSKGGQGSQTFVQAIGTGSDGVYLGGLFNVIANTTAPHVARWNGTNWFSLGAGITGVYNNNTLTVRALKAQGASMVVGGAFTTAGGLTANNIALWSGNNWSTLGFGVDDTVVAIETLGQVVYVGGTFTNAYDDPLTGWVMNRIGIWISGSGWFPMGSGMSGTVNAICADGAGFVYAGGAFTTAGGIAANRVAVFDGANWSSLGAGAANGVNGTVSALLLDGSTLYVGGSFTTAGGLPAPAIAKWNGSSWSAVGNGMFHTSTASVTALAKIGSYLYAGGVFTNAGGAVITRNIARWDGIKWEALGSGVGNESTPGASRASVMTASGNDLFVGGIFETAGVTDSEYVARWNDQIDFTPPSLMRLTAPQMLAGNNFKFRAYSTERAAYVVEYSTNLTTWTPLTTNGGAMYVDLTNAVAGSNLRSYRMRQIP